MVLQAVDQLSSLTLKRRRFETRLVEMKLEAEEEQKRREVEVRRQAQEWYDTYVDQDWKRGRKNGGDT